MRALLRLCLGFHDPKAAGFCDRANEVQHIMFALVGATAVIEMEFEITLEDRRLPRDVMAIFDTGLL